MGKVGYDAKFCLYMEGNLVSEANYLREAIFDLFCFYNIFDIKYNKSVFAILLFFQCTMFKINPADLEGKVPEGLANFFTLMNLI